MKDSDTEIEGKRATRNCSYCGRSFQGKYINQAIKRHLQIHEGYTTYVCEICERGFRDQTELTKHKRNKHSEAKLIEYVSDEDTEIESKVTKEAKRKCSYCGRTFQGKYMDQLIRRHLQIHEGYSKYVCEICKRGFRDQTGLTTHKEKHHNESKHFECAICEKSFHLFLDLKRHIERNNQNKENTFECMICNQIFEEYCLLASHRSDHFKCNDCSKSFEYQYHLDRHKSVHTKGKLSSLKSSSD